MQGADGSPTRRFGVFEVDLRAAELRKRGVRIKLQEQPFQILSLLLEHPGEVVTREELRQKLWPVHTFVDFDRGLNKAMTKLRFALGDSPDSPRYVETIPRHGYRFLSPVHVFGAEETALARTPVQVTALAGPVSTSLATHAVPVGGFIFRGSWRYFGGVAAVLLALVVGGTYLRMRTVVLSESGPAINPRRSVAVIGFKNLSGDPREEWLSTALSDWLTTELTAGEQIRAIPAESISRMKLELALPDVDSLSRDSLQRIRQNIGPDVVVAGSYAALGAKPDGQIRLDLRLQDTQSGETIDSVSESGSESHLLQLVSSAGEQLRARLGVRAVTTAEAAEVAIALPAKSEAAKLYAEGLARLRVFDALAARDLFQKAIAAEPSFALSHSALATTWSDLGYEEKAKLEARKSFDLSSNLPRAGRLLVEGRYREVSRDWSRAIEIYRALFDFFPDNLDYGLALAQAQLGANRWRDALGTVSVLRELPVPLRDNPQIDFVENNAAQALGDAKRGDLALARAVANAQVSGASLLLAEGRRQQAWLYENSGRQDLVEQAIREAKTLYLAANNRLGVARTTTLEGIVLERQGDYVGAKGKYEESLVIYREAGSKLSLSNQYDNLGDVLLYLGDLKGARESYQAALTTYQEIGDENGAALAKLGLGDVALESGYLERAKSLYTDASELCRELGNPTRQASALVDLARVQRLQGDLAGARQNSAEALARFDEASDKSESAHARLQLAQLALDEGKTAEADSQAQQAASIFEQLQANRYRAEAMLLVSQAMLAEGRFDEARPNLDLVMNLARKSHNRELELSASITEVRLQALSGHGPYASSWAPKLKQIASDAEAGHFSELALEARLALGELELESGSSVARTHLDAMGRDALAAGSSLLANRAKELLRNDAPQNAHN